MSGIAPPRESPSCNMVRHWPLGAGLALIALLWGGPLPERAVGSFAAHMTMHMGVVAVAAPLLAIGLLRSLPSLFSGLTARLVLLAALFEFAIVWGWHAPALHDAARRDLPMLVLEQASFLAAGLFVWLSALGAAGQDASGLPPPGAGAGPVPLSLRDFGRQARAAGIAGLLVTSMHMTLLGALLSLSPRPLYACAGICSSMATRTPLADQQLGGLIMLAVGGVAYMAGGLGLLASMLHERRDFGHTSGGPA